MTAKSQRCHRLIFFLNDQELAQFKLEVKHSRLSTPNFIRHRCLSITKRNQVALSHIQLYQKLGALQQQIESLTQQATTGKLNDEALAQQLTVHLEAIRTIRAEVVMLEQDTLGQENDAGR